MENSKTMSNKINNLENLPQNLEETTQHSKQVLKQSVAVAFARTGTTPPEVNVIDAMVEDIFSEFPEINEFHIKKALRNGGLGVYGKTYKLTTQELCIWIRRYYQEKIEPPKKQLNPLTPDVMHQAKYIPALRDDLLRQGYTMAQIEGSEI